MYKRSFNNSSCASDSDEGFPNKLHQQFDMRYVRITIHFSLIPFTVNGNERCINSACMFFTVLDPPR